MAQLDFKRFKPVRGFGIEETRKRALLRLREPIGWRRLNANPMAVSRLNGNPC